MEKWIETTSKHTPLILTYCTSYVSLPVLSEEKFNEMENSRWFGEDKRRSASIRKILRMPTIYLYMSVFEQTVS